MFFDFASGRANQKARFGGELLPNVVESGSGLAFADFFQNERDGGRTGIVVMLIGGIVITNEVQRRVTEGHLRQFEEALANLKAKTSGRKRSKLAQLEIDAVRSQADDLRVELNDYDRLRSGEL